MVKVLANNIVTTLIIVANRVILKFIQSGVLVWFE